MALTKDIEYLGVPIPGAYIKVENVSATSNSLTAMVVWRATAESPPLKNKLFSLAYDLEGDNPIKQAYQGLKALAEFAGAVDA